MPFVSPTGSSRLTSVALWGAPSAAFGASAKMNFKGVFHQSTALVAALSLALAGCGGGGGGGGSNPGTGTPAPSPTPTPIGVLSPPAQEALSVSDVQRVIAQAVGEAQARNLPSVIAVVDRPGNVLGVFRMNGARATMVTSRFIRVNGTLNDPP